VPFIIGFPLQQPRFDPRAGHVGFIENKMALGQVFSEYFSFPLPILIPPNVPVPVYFL
jgi:hypothetical protein